MHSYVPLYVKAETDYHREKIRRDLAGRRRSLPTGARRRRFGGQIWS